jgi:N-acetylmuramoyl-L-alanine amidase
VTAGVSVDGTYCASTEQAVRAFQEARGLRADGICDEDTWSALVEASWALGDRLLYHRSPNLRGDDVAELQRRLGRLGFDAGRVDGIFGPLTATALEEFQRNVGLPADGICGYESIQAMHRLGARTEDGQHVATVRELDHLRRSAPGLRAKRVVVGHEGGLGALARTAGRTLRVQGATVIVVDEPEGSTQASAANRFGADVFVGLAPGAQHCFVAYYAVPGFESVGGRRLADLLTDELGSAMGRPPDPPRGMRLPVLRETRMPAVVCELAPLRSMIDAGALVSAAIGQALARWVETPD